MIATVNVLENLAGLGELHFLNSVALTCAGGIFTAKAYGPQRTCAASTSRYETGNASSENAKLSDLKRIDHLPQMLRLSHQPLFPPLNLNKRPTQKTLIYVLVPQER